MYCDLCQLERLLALHCGAHKETLSIGGKDVRTLIQIFIQAPHSWVSGTYMYPILNLCLQRLVKACAPLAQEGMQQVQGTEEACCGL